MHIDSTTVRAYRTHLEKRYYNQNCFLTYWVTKDILGCTYGTSFEDQYLVIREDLPGMVKNFIAYREAHKLRLDPKKPRRFPLLSINLIAALKYPIGGCTMLLMSMANKERRDLDLFRRKQLLN